MSHSIDETIQAPSSPMQPNAQMESPLFGKLPPELRAIIYLEVFGGRRVNLEFMEAWQASGRSRWRHGDCEGGLVVPFACVVSHEHDCLSAPRRQVLDTSLLWTCRRALLEGIPTWYQSNVFVNANAGCRRPPVDGICSLQAHIPRHSPLIRSLDIEQSGV